MVDEAAKVDFSFKKIFPPLTTVKAIVIIVIIGFIVYSNSLFNGFVWDDYPFILDNTDIHSFSISKLIGLSVFNSDSYYRPIPALYFTLLYHIANSHAFLYHLVQVSLHIIYTILLMQFFQFFLRKPVSILLALIFLVHPMNVESVSYISATTSLLFSLPGLLALRLMQRPRLTLIHFFYIAALLLLSLLAKETGILFLIVGLVFSLLYQRHYLKQVTITESLVLFLYIFIRLAIISMNKTPLNDIFLQNQNATDWFFIPIAHLSLYEKLFNIPAILLYHLKTFVYPVQLRIDQMWVLSPSNPTTVYQPLAISTIVFICLLTICAYLFNVNRKAFNVYIFFFIWFVFGLGLHLPIFSPLYMTVADRWFYFPIIGLLGMIGTALPVIVKHKHHMVGLSFAVILILLFSVRTAIRNANFADRITLYSHDSRLQPNARLEAELGRLHLTDGNTQAALIHLQKANHLHRSGRSLYMLGFWNEYQGYFSQAVDYYSQAYNLIKTTRSRPNKQIYERLSYALIISGDLKAATIIAKEGRLLFPHSDVLWYNEAVIQYTRYDHSFALLAIEKARSLKPNPEYDLIYQAIITKQPPSQLLPAIDTTH